MVPRRKCSAFWLFDFNPVLTATASRVDNCPQFLIRRDVDYCPVRENQAAQSKRHKDEPTTTKRLTSGEHTLSLANLFLVGRCVFQLFEIVGVVELEDVDPALAVGFAVD
jgi:hypothetical protein